MEMYGAEPGVPARHAGTLALTACFERGLPSVVMTVDLRELLALPYEERERLAEALVESTVPRDLGPLLREYVCGLEATNRALESALERLSHLDERLERARAEAREQVLRSGVRLPPPPAP